jgi:hypothetical protein
MNQKKEKNKKKYNVNKIFVYTLAFCAFLFSFFCHNTALASTTVNFSPASGLYMIGDTVKVKLVLSSDVSVNAISFKVKFPSDLLDLTSISQAGSVVSLWAQEPTFSNANGTADLEGVILNGYTGSGATVATLIFKAKSIGKANLDFETGSVYANDGNGTDVGSGKGTSSLTIIQNTNVVPPPVVTKSDTNISILEIENNNANYSQNEFLITASRPVKDNLYYIQIDALPPAVWTDDGSHIYTALNISEGEHSIKAIAVDTSLNVLNGSLDFSTAVLKVPTITYYLKNISPDEFMVLKGVADPSVDVEITLTNKNTGSVIVDHVETNSDGSFTYVPENKLTVGTYSITARAGVSGVYSGYMTPILVVVKENLFNVFVSKLSGYLNVLTPLIAIIILLIFIILYGIYRIKKFRIQLKMKLLETEKSLSQDFKTLEEDVDEENLILQKARENKPLATEENTFMDKFKKDIESTVGNLAKDVNDLDK